MSIDTRKKGPPSPSTVSSSARSPSDSGWSNTAGKRRGIQNKKWNEKERKNRTQSALFNSFTLMQFLLCNAPLHSFWHCSSAAAKSFFSHNCNGYFTAAVGSMSHNNAAPPR